MGVRCRRPCVTGHFILAQVFVLAGGVQS